MNKPQPLQKGDRVYWRNSRGFRSHGAVYDFLDRGNVLVEVDVRWYPIGGIGKGPTGRPRYQVDLSKIHRSGTHGFVYDAKRLDSDAEFFGDEHTCHLQCSLQVTAEDED